MKPFSFHTVFALGVAICFLGPAFGQEAERNEVAGFAGLLHSKEANEFVVGGDYTRDLTKLFAFETQADYSRNTQGGITTNSYLLAAGPQLLVPTHSRVKPYLGAGAGVLHVSAGGLGFESDSVNKFAAECGGGVRIEAGKRWGFNPEFKVIKAVDLPVFTRATFGVFYRF